MTIKPAYLALMEQGGLAARAREAQDRLACCDLCARYCRVDRRATRAGVICRTGVRAVVASYGPHHGEERPLSGSRGSGTIFFASCNLRCVYCQNSDISQRMDGREVTADELAGIMLELQAMGCHNVNLVSPSHVVAQAIAAVAIAAPRGLAIPIVYNTGGYDGIEALRLLDGVIDIYMPDLKYGNDENGHVYSHVRDYWSVARAAVLEMRRQVGDLVVDASGIARRGMLVRHLVLPEDIAGSRVVFAFLAGEVSRATYLNVMDQYRPCYHAADYAPIGRPLRAAEFAAAIAAAHDSGLRRLDHERSRRWRGG